VNDADSWLEARLTEAPAALRTAVQRAMGSVQRGGKTADGGTRLRERAAELLVEARNGPATRETALKLLAADALMTLACDWVAEHEPERLRD